MNYEHPNNTKTFSIPCRRGKEKSEKMYGWYRGKAESFGCIFVLSSLQLLCKHIRRWLSFIKSLSFDLFSVCVQTLSAGLIFLWHGFINLSFANRNFVLHFLLDYRQLLADRSSWLPSLTSLKIVSPQLGIYACVHGASNSLEGDLFVPSLLPAPSWFSILSMLGIFWCWELEFVPCPFCHNKMLGIYMLPFLRSPKPLPMFGLHVVYQSFIEDRTNLSPPTYIRRAWIPRPWHPLDSFESPPT